MAGTSNFLLFDQNQTNIQTDSQYQNDTDRLNGMQQGISRSILFNKVLFQSSAMITALATVAANRGYDMIDSNQAGLVEALNNSFPINRALEVGVLIPTTVPMTTPPTGYLFPDGQPFNPNTYTELASKYKTGTNTYYYGQTQVNGVWWPRTPDLRAAFVRCMDWSLGKDSGHTLGTVQSDGVGPHQHNLRVFYDNGWLRPTATTYMSGAIRAASSNRELWANSYNIENTASITSSTGISETRPYNVALPFLIVAVSGINTNDFSGIGPHATVVTVNIPVSGWDSENQTQTVTVEGVTAAGNIDMGLPVPTSFDNSQAVAGAGLVITGLGQNTITFTAKSLPTVDLSVSIKIWSE